MPHDLFLQWPVNYKHASFCRQTQGKAEIPRHLMFWQLGKRITVIFKLTVWQSYFTHFLVLLAPALLELLLHLFSRALSCSLFRCSSLLFRLFSWAFCCSFSRCSSVQFTPVYSSSFLFFPPLFVTDTLPVCSCPFLFFLPLFVTDSQPTNKQNWLRK